MKRFLLRWTVDLWYRRTMSYREQMIQGVGHGRRNWKSPGIDWEQWERERAAYATLRRGLDILDQLTTAQNDAADATRQAALAFEALNGIDKP